LKPESLTSRKLQLNSAANRIQQQNLPCWSGRVIGFWRINNNERGLELGAAGRGDRAAFIPGADCAGPRDGGDPQTFGRRA